MDETMILNILTTVGCLGGSMCLVVRQEMYSPRYDTFPPAPFWIRGAMWVWLIILFFLGWRQFFATVDGTLSIPPDATWHMAIKSLGILAYEIAWLVWTLRERKTTVLAALLALAFLPYKGRTKDERAAH